MYHWTPGHFVARLLTFMRCMWALHLTRAQRTVFWTWWYNQTCNRIIYEFYTTVMYKCYSVVLLMFCNGHWIPKRRVLKFPWELDSWTIKEPHLPYKTDLDVTQSHPLRRTRFGQYLISCAGVTGRWGLLPHAHKCSQLTDLAVCNMLMMVHSLSCDTKPVWGGTFLHLC